MIPIRDNLALGLFSRKHWSPPMNVHPCLSQKRLPIVVLPEPDIPDTNTHLCCDISTERIKERISFLFCVNAADVFRMPPKIKKVVNNAPVDVNLEKPQLPRRQVWPNSSMSRLEIYMRDEHKSCARWALLESSLEAMKTKKKVKYPTESIEVSWQRVQYLR